MEIKNGLVQWNGRDDIPCSYVDSEDGVRYFIKQDLANGNHIVTTSLLELVDPSTKAKNIGLMGVEGGLLLPCNNTSIKVIDNIILVEPAEAISENVKEANALRMDPLAATRLVTTPAQIKEKIPASDYKFYNQFSEATICDLNGNNLINNEYFSFIAKDGDKLFMAKNNVDTEIVEFSINGAKVVEKEAPVQEVETTPVQEEVQAVETVSQEVPVVETPQVEIPTVENNVVETPITEEVPAVENASEEVSTEGLSFGDIEVETPTVEVGEDNQDADDYMNESEFEKSLKSLEEKNEKYDSYNSLLSQFSGETPVSEDTEDYSDVFANSEVKVDNIDYEVENDVYDGIDEPAEVIKDGTAENIYKTVNALMTSLTEAREKVDKLESSRRIVAEKAKAVSQKNETLTASVHNLEVAKDKLESKNHDQARIIDLQKREIEELKRENSKFRSQIENINNLDELMADANALMNDEGPSYIRRAA